MPGPRPPERADALLLHVLPPGVDTLTIVGDLHREHAEVYAERGRRRADRWYWSAALGISAHYGARRARAWLTQREGRTGEMGSTLLADARFGVRMLLKTPGLSAVAVLTIALGVGLTTHTYSTVDGSVLRGLPVPGADRLVFVTETDPSRGLRESSLPLRDYLDLAEQQTAFEGIAAFNDGTVNLAGDDGPPERYRGALVSAGALELVGVDPILGRTFAVGEDAPDAAPRMVLGYDVWRERFAGDPAIVGRVVRANGLATEIVGVMPEGFRFPFDGDLWLTHRLDPNATTERRRDFVEVFAKLRAGVSLEAGQAELDAVSARLAATFPEDNATVRMELQPYAERFMPSQITAVMFLMLVATFGVLMIACANVANLLLARASIRSREVAIRSAMGASRWRVVRQLLAESLVLALLGGVMGVALAYVGVDAFNTSIAAIEKPYWIQIRVDGPALLFALGMTVLASLAAGAVPALRASGFGMGEILKSEGRGGSSRRLGRFATTLVVGEIAVSCGLLIAAGLMIKSVANLRNVDLGFEAEGVLGGRVGLFRADYPTRDDRAAFFQEMQRRLGAEPGVEDVALADWLPAVGASRWAITVEGDSYAEDIDYPIVNGNVVTDGYFRVLDVPILRGRDLTAADAWDRSDPVAIVNQSFVRGVLGGRDPLGMRIRLGREGSSSPFARIVGVVPDLYVGGNVGGIGDDRIPPEQIYLTPATVDVSFMTALLGTEMAPESLAPALRRVVADLDPNLPVYRLGPLPDAIEQATWAFGLFGSLFTIFGIAALFMAAVGLYGVMAFSVAQRRQEMGVRIALGAGPRAILGLVLQRGVVQLGVGMVLGLALGYALSRPLGVVTFGVELLDPVVYGSIVVTLGLTGLVATLVPARRATRADPVEAMRPQ